MPGAAVIAHLLAEPLSWPLPEPPPIVFPPHLVEVPARPRTLSVVARRRVYEIAARVRVFDVAARPRQEPTRMGQSTASARLEEPSLEFYKLQAEGWGVAIHFKARLRPGQILSEVDANAVARTAGQSDDQTSAVLDSPPLVVDVASSKVTYYHKSGTAKGAYDIFVSVYPAGEDDPLVEWHRLTVV